jgi:predicted enzyme related to lactoylglutathione lyase
MRLSRVYFMLWVADMDQAARFYKQVFGLDEAYRSPDWTELRFGDTTLALHSRTAHLPQQHTGLGFEVDDVEQACRAVTAARGEIIAGPSRREDEGIVVADCADPDGNRFSLAQPLGD